MSDLGDHLLYMVSARRELSWPAFRDAFDTLASAWLAEREAAGEIPSAARWQCVTALDALAHADLSFGQGEGKVWAAPPVLARLPVSGPPQAVLCGARAPSTGAVVMAEAGKSGCCLADESQDSRRANTPLPRRFCLKASRLEHLQFLASALSIRFADVPPAWGLLQFGGTLDGYLASRKVRTDPDLNWRRWDFDPRTYQFVLAGPAREPGGTLRLSRYEHPHRATYLYLLWHGKTYREVERNWGRYAVLGHLGMNVLAYDVRHFQLAVPSGAQLPRLFGRALALCSGFAPLWLPKDRWDLNLGDQRGYDLFEQVPPDMARTLANKLGQHLVTMAFPPLPEEFTP